MRAFRVNQYIISQTECDEIRFIIFVMSNLGLSETFLVWFIMNAAEMAVQLTMQY